MYLQTRNNSVKDKRHKPEPSLFRASAAGSPGVVVEEPPQRFRTSECMPLASALQSQIVILHPHKMIGAIRNRCDLLP